MTGKNKEDLQHRLGFSNLLLSILVILFFLPLTQLIISTVWSVLRGEAELGLIYPTGRRFTLLLNSFGLAGSVAFTVTVTGFLCGTYLLGASNGFLDKIRWGFLLTAPVPPYIHALTWSSALRVFRSFLGSYGGLIPSSGFFMSYCVYVLAYLPMGIGLAMMGILLVEAPAVEAARMIRKDLDVLLKVVSPMALPAFISSLGLVFILVITDFSVPTLYTYHVYSLEIFSEFSASNNPVNSALLSTPILVITFLALNLSIHKLKATAQSSSVGTINDLRGWKLPPLFKFAQKLGLYVAVFQVSVLMGGLVFGTGGITSLWYALAAARDDMVTSMVIGLSAAVIGMGFGVLLAEKLESPIWWGVISIPLALPSSLIGVSLIHSSTTLLPFLYGTMMSPILVTVTRFTSFAAIIIYAQKKRMDPLLFEAAEIFETNNNEAWSKVKLPLQKHGLAAALMTILAMSLGELGGTLLVVPPGRGTLTIRVFNYLHYGGSEEVAGLCLVLVVSMLVLTWVSVWVYNRRVEK